MAMKSNEVIKAATSRIGVKAVAHRMGLSESMVYKWSQECDDAEPERSGASNPLDRTAELFEITRDPQLIYWVCEHAGGYFVENEKNIEAKKITPEVIRHTQLMIKEFSDLLGQISAAIADGSGIDAKEAERIRREWERLKRSAEGFVIGCEKGVFDP